MPNLFFYFMHSPSRQAGPNWLPMKASCFFLPHTYIHTYIRTYFILLPCINYHLCIADVCMGMNHLVRRNPSSGKTETQKANALHSCLLSAPTHPRGVWGGRSVSCSFYTSSIVCDGTCRSSVSLYLRDTGHAAWGPFQLKPRCTFQSR